MKENIAVIPSQFSNWRWNLPTFAKQNGTIIPFYRGIAAPVCGLVRDDRECFDRQNIKLQLFAEEAAEIPAEAAPAEVEAAPQVDGNLLRQHWAAVDRIYGAWMEQGEQLKQLFPSFDMAAEMKNPAFARLIRAGVDVNSAYQVLHGKEILPAAMEYAAKTVERRMAQAMRGSAMRPGENGLRGGGAVVAGGTVAGLSRQDYARICRLVERGERVSFG